MVSEKFYVGYSEINKDFELSNVSLLDYFQDITTIHGKSVGDSLATTDFGWFLTGYKVKIYNRPKYENWFNLSTWSRGTKGAMASREFEIKDELGEIQVKAISNWVRVNKNTQKVERISAETARAYSTEEQSNFDEIWLDKLSECGDLSYQKLFTADRNFVDFYNHVNNVAYLKIANVVLPDRAFEKELNEFEVMYRNAIKLGETVKCLVTETSEYYNITIKNMDLSELKAIIRFYK